MSKPKNTYGLEEEKLEWLESIGAMPYDEPMIYGCITEGGDSHSFSGKYIRETPIENLKSNYERGQRIKKRTFLERHPKFPTWFSLIALLIVIAKECLACTHP